MKRYFPLAIFSLLHFYADAQITAIQWQEDIKYFKTELAKRHMNAFHRVSKEEFEKDIDQLYKDVPSLPDYQVIVRLMQLTAKVGDSHTAVHLPASFKRYPIRLNWFENDLYAVATKPSCRSVLGSRLVKIGDLDIQNVHEKLAAVITQDQNAWYTMYMTSAFLTIPEILVTLGIVNDYAHATFTFVDSTNQEIKIDLVPESVDQTTPWTSANKAQPLFSQKLNDPFWFTYLEDIGAVYLNFKKYDNLAADAKELFAFLESHHATKLIVDLRFNGGGDFIKGRKHLISKIKENSTLNQEGNLFVITGRGTFSAAMVNSIDFEKETHAILIGEPPGEKPNSYSENDELKLPNSKLVVSYSTRYYKFLDEDVTAFEPDIRIDPAWIEFKEGRDPVMEWIIKYCKK